MRNRPLRMGRILRYGGTNAVVTPTTLLAQMPAGVTGLWTMDKYVASPRPTVANQASANPVSTNILSASRSCMGTKFGIFANSGNFTITDDVTSPYDGTTNASTLAWGSVSALLQAVYNPVSATTVTLSFDVATTDAATVNFLAGGNSSPATVSATPILTRQSVTFTASGSNQPCIKSFNASTPANLIFDNVTLHFGSSDLGRDTLAGHIMLGKTAWDTLPGTGTANMIDMSNGSTGIIQLGALTNLSAFTFIGIGKRTTTTANNITETTIYKAGAQNTFAPAMDYGFAGGHFDGYIGGSQYFFAGPSTPNGYIWPRANELHSIAQRYGDGRWTIFEDDVKMQSFASSTLTVGSIKDLIFANSNHKFSYAAVALYNRALSDSEMLTAYGVLRSYLAGKSVSVNTSPTFVLAEGDSLTAGTGSADGNGSYAHRASLNFTSAMGFCTAVGGAVVGANTDAPGTNSLYGRAASDLAMIPANKNGRQYALTILIGRNDWNTAGIAADPTGFAATVAAYAATMKGASKFDKIVICTVFPSITSGFNAWRNTVNGVFKGAGWAAANGIDAICDLASETTIGIDGNGTTTGPWNTTYYNADGTHLLNAGYALAEPIYRATVNAL